VTVREMIMEMHPELTGLPGQQAPDQKDGQ
jgi:hypothetical protein